MQGSGLRWMLLLLALVGSEAWLDDILTFVDMAHLQPGCNIMFSPGAWCFPKPAPFVQSCCTPGFECLADSSSLFGHSCQQLPTSQLSYSFGSTYGRCDNKVAPGGQCGGGGGACKQYGTCGNTGPWVNFCCPDGFSCQPNTQNYGRVWSCQPDVTHQAAVSDEKEALRYPPRKLPPDACTCRVTGGGERVPTKCPGPWDHAAGTKMAPTPVKVGAGGRFYSTETGADVVIRGVNWFGWNVGAYNFDGLWAFCDDNYTASSPPCGQDGEIPPHFPEPAVGEEGVKRLGGIRFWGKRTMTNDFATVVYRMKLLGFNAIRIPFSFADLNEDIPPPSSGPTEFFPCMADSDSDIAYRTMDPELRRIVAQKGGSFQAPSGPNLPAIQRFLWQVQYVVSQGMYVVLAFSSSRDPEPNAASAPLFARNWQSLWKMLRDSPQYSRLKGRILADLANEPSHWGCQWDRPCTLSNFSAPACVPGILLYASAASAIHAVDPDVPILIEGMGQDVQRGKYRECAPNSYPGIIWGEGFITNGPTITKYGISDPSGIFALNDFKKLGPLVFAKTEPPNQLVLAPHVYPRSITGADESLEDEEAEITWKWDMSWGWKSLGIDYTSSGEPLRDIGLVVGEFGTRDGGDNSVNNTDTTAYGAHDRAFLKLFARYLNALSWQNGPASWLWWSWNANSGDTKGLVGPMTTWREVQWTKIRLLTRSFGLTPWYCTWVSPEFCQTLTW
ncbi:MAG: glycoside hydrolase superfamily [Monoraphidium minutum]|nr:MAG: glycoside hydrolase superfamily [Monoraphidium minutum]